MQRELQNIVKTYMWRLLPNYQEARYLLTVSGGIDSVVMSHLFNKLGLAFGIAHCNFALRGEESNGDEEFVSQLSNNLGVPYFTKQFDTKNFAEQTQVSTQMAARQLRYEWFEELRKENGFDFIVTAHHQSDQLETILINQLRGTGTDGLAGITPLEGSVFRPLLCITRSAIMAYAETHQLTWREDSSNVEDKYWRNKIRHHILPVMQSLNPSIEETFTRNASRAKDSTAILKKYATDLKTKIAHQSNGNTTLDCGQLHRNDYNPSVVLAWIDSYGFNYFQAVCIFEALQTSTGKKFYADKYVLFIDRGQILICPKTEEQTEQLIIKKEDDQLLFSKGLLNISHFSKESDFVIPNANNIACLDAEQISFPLTLRYWQQGDYIFPLGMSGKKLLSDFFIDEKFSQYEKEHTPLLCHESEVLWVINRRINDKVKLKPDTRTIYQLEFITE